MRAHPLVSILIVNWNGKDVLSACLKSLAAITYSPVEVIVYDNNSTDGSVAYVKKHFPTVTVIAGKRNVGFAEGNTRALKRARGAYILLLNSDTVVPPDFLAPLVAHLEEHKNVAVVQPKIMFKGITHCLMALSTP